MIAIVLVIAGWQTFNLIVVLGAARLGVVRITAGRPAPRKPPEAKQ